uniref:E3 ubiquitin-protein ligase n=1 Tax=Caenorhabditis japonica TaxID=281687 RepID=A0A8R1IBI4_CAEJA
VVKLLLQRGANPDLRDEDGKTALDKARERSDDDHNQVANILESPSAFMRNKEEQKNKSTSSTSQQPGTSSKPELPNPQLVRKVLHQLLPIFCEIFQKSLNATVRRTSLSLMRKIVENIGDLRQNIDDAAPNTKERKMSADVSAGAESLIAVVVSVMDQEDDHEGHEQVLLILESLLEKDAELWVTELVRLGVFERVEAMAKEPPKGLEEVNRSIFRVFT